MAARTSCRLWDWRQSPNIVCGRGLDLAAGVSTAIFQNAGQTCSAGSRLLVERKAYGHWSSGWRRAVACGSARASDPDMGPII
jgi:acyl-CoA reductase-like NAD-dependent aldehyde dehydrogenase